jgi:hypothetical protein
MRLFIELSCALLVVVPSGAATLTDAQNVTNNVDLFLQSCNIDPLKLDDTAKKVGSTTLACAIFEVLWNGETIAAANSSIYTIEREAHW